MKMGVSFLSTSPPLTAPLLPLEFSVNKPLMHPLSLVMCSKQARIRCSKNEASFSDEERHFSSRGVIGGLTLSAPLFVIGSSGLFLENANAADLIQRRQRSDFQSSVKGTLYALFKSDPDLISPILTLALNDAINYDKATKTGGPNGSIRFSSEIDRPENKRLSPALSLLQETKKEIDSYSKGGPISFADLIQFAAQAAIKANFLAAAIRKCGGNEEKGRLLYTAYGSNGQWGQFDKIFGRTDAQEPDPEGRVPQWDKATVKEMKDKFSSVGLGPRQLAVLSAFLGPDQLATETLLATDPDVAPWVQKYQRSRETVSETDYEVDLITTLTKLSSLGQSINYEAYTYPSWRSRLAFLKKLLPRLPEEPPNSLPGRAGQRLHQSTAVHHCCTP